ncbi:MAG: hypothetical protein Q8R02_25060 [Hyphomonadaceae bacterium]|nr:hypothetical protein [Hyphomonadaceae bacterium]
MKRLMLAVCVASFAIPPAIAQEGQAAAAASCTAPAAPATYLPAALPADPATPKCLNLEKNLSTCTDRVLNDWNAKSKAQNDLKRARVNEMNAYTRELQKYQNSATDYAQCEQERVAKFLPG